MSENLSTYLTDAQETFSGGLFLTHYGMLSDPPTSKGMLDPTDLFADEPFSVTFEATLDHLEVPRSFKFVGSDKYALTKYLCCALIYGMPDDGLEECWSTIKDIHQFYSVAPVQVLPSPSVKKVGAALT